MSAEFGTASSKKKKKDRGVTGAVGPASSKEKNKNRGVTGAVGLASSKEKKKDRGVTGVVGPASSKEKKEDRGVTGAVGLASSLIDPVWMWCEAAVASSNASRMWEAAAEAASAEEILEAASEEEPLEAASAEEPLEAASAEEPLQAASEEEILEAANGEKILATRAKAKWRRTSCIGHRVLVPKPPAKAPPANLLDEVDRKFAAVRAKTKCRVLVPKPPAEAPPANLLNKVDRKFAAAPMPLERRVPSSAASSGLVRASSGPLRGLVRPRPGLVPLVVGLQVPRPKKRPAPSSAASLAPHPPAEAPPEALLWAAMVARLLPEEVTFAALLEVPRACTDTSADTSAVPRK